MKTFTKNLFGLITILLLPPLYAQFNLGIIGGMNSSGLKEDAPARAKYASSSEIAAGIIAEYKIKNDVIMLVRC